MQEHDSGTLTLAELERLERQAVARYNMESDRSGPIVFDASAGLGPEDARWPGHDTDPNTKHLFVTTSAADFVFTAAHLERLCALNRFELPAEQDRVIFGLRGCKIAGGAASVDFTSRVTLNEDTPDLATPRCVIGVWRRSTGDLAVSRANTVPYWFYVDQYMGGGAGANMLPTGRYRYVVGPHRDMPGALRLGESNVIVLRPDKNKKNISFEVTDLWDGPCSPFDNIHPAFDNSKPLQRTGSAGCQTIPGSYVNGQHLGEWVSFRKRSGVDSAADGTPYTYILLTGREARLAANEAPSNVLSRLRFGSSGPDVAALQAALGLGADGAWGPNTSRALITWQWKNLGGWADGIVTPERAAKLGFTLS